MRARAREELPVEFEASRCTGADRVGRDHRERELAHARRVRHAGAAGGVQFVHANVVGALVQFAVGVTGVPTTGNGAPEVIVHAGVPAAGAAGAASAVQNATGRCGLPVHSIT